MSVPLRKEEPEFENELDENLATADLAQGTRPAAETRFEPTDRLNLKSERRELDQELKIEDRIENRREDSIDDPGVNAGIDRIVVQKIDRAADQNSDSIDRPRPVLAEKPAGAIQSTAVAGNASTPAPLFPNNELEGLRNRWSEVQTAFVDEPRSAVEKADGLVAAAMKRLAEVFAEERSKLEQQWDRGDNVSTEDLRIALQRYRSFFQRLLSI
jgi:hypothetical protein